MKVLQIVPYLGKDGISSFLLNYLSEFDKNEVSFDFITMEINSESVNEFIKSKNGKIFVIPLVSPTFFICLFKIVIFFFKNSHQYKVIHVHQIGAGFIYLFLAWLFRIPVRIAHSHSCLYSYSKLKAFFQKIMTQFFLIFATDYWACSNIAGTFMYGKKKWKKEGVLIKNAINLSRYAFSDMSRFMIRKEFNLHNTNICLFVGNLFSSKNPFFMLDVFCEIINLDPHAVLLICGHNVMGNKIEKYIYERNIQDKVILLGIRNDVERFYSAADILLFPSLAEGLGFVVIEAQGAGLPCLISDGVPEDAVILDTTIRYPLEKSAKEWAEQAERMIKVGRHSNIEEKIEQAGYNIDSASKILQQLYKNLFSQR